MKFGRLLAAGKSLVNGNVAGRYQMRQGMNLPQFISPKNPFKQEAAARSVAPPPEAAAPANVSRRESALVLVAVKASANVSPEIAAPVASLEISRPSGRGAKAVMPVAWNGMGFFAAAALKVRSAAKQMGEAIYRAAMFCLDHNPFSAIGRPKLAGIPRFGKPAVQAELSLDRVRVVRNDLAHADLEVVRAGGGAK